MQDPSSSLHLSDKNKLINSKVISIPIVAARGMVARIALKQ